MKERILISEVAREVGVEAYVLRRWEEELEITIQRNVQGHRRYTLEDVERLRQIKELKERGYQARTIKALLRENALITSGMRIEITGAGS